MPIDIDAIQRSILEQRAKWVARPHPSFIELTEDQLRRKLGVIVDEKRLAALRQAPAPEIVKVIAHFETSRTVPFDRAQISREAVSRVADRLRLADQAVTQLTQEGELTSSTAQLLLQVDWRNRKGRNNVTSVKDQGGFGSCVSFGVTATLGSIILTQHTFSFHLSESSLF